MALQPKNYHAGGGDKWVVGGELIIEDGATVTGLDSGGGLPEGGTNGQVLKIVADEPAWAADTNTTYTAMSAAQATTGTATTAQTISALVLAGAIAERLPDAPEWDDVTGKPTTFPPVVGTGAADAKAGNYQPTWAQVTSKPVGVAVADAEDEVDVVAQFNALLASLRTAGFIAT